MAKVTENLPKTTGHSATNGEESLVAMIQSVGDETTGRYYVGRGPLSMPVPTNLLMFTRQEREILIGSATSHHRFVLVVNAGGAGTVVLDDVLLPFSPGQAILILPYQYHHYTNLREDPLCWLFITFESAESKYYELLRYRPTRQNEAIRGHVERMCEHWNLAAPQPADDDRLLLECALLLREMTRQAGRSKSPRIKAGPAGPGRLLLQRIGDYLNSHLDQPVQVADLAQHVSLSESHLRSRFRQQFGMSLGRYIRRTKIARASQLLDVTDLTVSEVAQSCGFESIYSFSRAFRRQVDVSPRQYRMRQNTTRRNPAP